MKKPLDWFENNFLKLSVGFLLIFIPLWPKLPLVDIMHTWVYIRLEDFVVLAVVLVWIILALSKKVSLKTPLTLPIMLFWIIGAISTIHSVLLIIPKLTDVFPNVALLNYLRRIEYMSLFFVAFSAMKERKFISRIVIILMAVLFLVFAYGLGQRFLGFPAYLTMNEEFAKGLAVRLSSMSRVSSTFGGHYDLAAYLVLILPILGSMVFGFKNRLVKLSLLTAMACGFITLFMTVSRISFAVLLVSLALMLFFQNKKKIVIISISLIILVILVMFNLSPGLWQRFGNTVKEVNILIDTNTGEELGHAEEVKLADYQGKKIRLLAFRNKASILPAIEEINKTKPATSAGLISPAVILPEVISLLTEPNAPTGENLPQGTGYINLGLSPIIKKPGEFLYEDPKVSNEIFVFTGEFLIKRALAYDLSFTTRFQGEWPRAGEAFQRNIIFGSGYSSVGLAVDNNYLRILAEVGLLGFSLFIGIFSLALVYIKKTLPKIDDPVEKSFVIGFVAGLFGLALNAIFIDVFEASKIAFLLWLLMGTVMGLLSFYQKGDNLAPLKEIKKILISTPAVIIYLFFLILILFSAIFKNYFIGDDFTWLRWAAEAKTAPLFSTILNYLTDSAGFFYRPGTKIYFLLMYKWFWLNQAVYYLTAVFLHFLACALFFLISGKILKSLPLSILAVFLFVILSGYLEAVFWISATGHLFNAVFILLALFCFMLWEEKEKNRYLALSFFSMVLSFFFHELGVISPLLIILYRFCFSQKKFFNPFLLLPIIPYLGLRFLAKSHWFNGDYNYNLIKLPANIIGNAFGYLTLDLFGPISLPFYQKLRDFSKGHLLIGLLLSLIIAYLFVTAYRKIIKKMAEAERKVVVFGFCFFVIALLPFLGLGNIASRYSYLSSMGFVLVLVILIKKFFEYLLTANNRINTLAVMTLAMSVFLLWHLVQLQKVQGDWFAASERVKRFLISADSLYSDSRTKETVKFDFVNVPIRYGDAWIFPTGLNDALWFVFHNPNLSLSQFSSADQALKIAGDSPDEKVLEFDSSGKLIERKKILQ